MSTESPPQVMSTAGKKRRKARDATSEPTATDVSIMGTNDSSIVSKRSVETLYHTKPHFFHHFVKKPRRRAPLINRGYWLRMKAIEHEVLAFLNEPTSKRRVVVNLGCGYDPLPFQILSKHARETRDVLFVDVDYPDLIRNKVAMIKAAPEIVDMLPEFTAPAQDLPLSSKNYVALGCDLGFPLVLQSLLETFLTTPDCAFCFVAEVSVTYMKEKAADALIKWAAGLGDTRFVQLEQCLPFTREHPFADTMLKHFASLGSRLRSLKSYPTESHQRQRFQTRGWKTATSRSLWKLWASPGFLTLHEKQQLDDFEPFDEWEEFALFANHYFVLTARSDGSTPIDTETLRSMQAEAKAKLDTHELTGATKPAITSVQGSASQTMLPAARSFAAVLHVDEHTVAVHGGNGPQGRMNDLEILTDLSPRYGNLSDSMPSILTGRLCHTITTVSGGETRGFILVGGRTSPGKGLSECWFTKQSSVLQGRADWQRLQALPQGIYRHGAVALGPNSRQTGGVLVYGGKSDGTRILNSWYLWWPATAEDFATTEWIQLKVKGKDTEPRFGVSLAATGSQSSDKPSGILFGGMNAAGTVVQEALTWSVDLDHATIELSRLECAGHGLSKMHNLHRFGGAIVPLDDCKTSFAVIGGIHPADAEPGSLQPITRFKLEHGSVSADEVSDTVTGLTYSTSPLLVGHSVAGIGDGRILMNGGGATCFSFGSYYNERPMVFEWQDRLQTWTTSKAPWTSLRAAKYRSVEAAQESKKPKPKRPTARRNHHLPPQETIVECLDGSYFTKEDFESLVDSRRPAIIRGLQLGKCTADWTLDYLKTTLGPDRQVVIHRSDVDAMDFQKKNFSYEKVKFCQFASEIENGARHYLRALSADSAKQAANFWKDYPELADDFSLPEQLSTYIQDTNKTGQVREHSSVLRVSGPVNMWLHYDVMSNVLCQIKGDKNLLLYPPEDVRHLQIPAGQSSSSLNMFAPETYTANDLSKIHPHRAELEPGDVLFLPALWMHTAHPTSGVSIALNVFFRDLDSGYAAGKDAYGNRDLQAYEDGRRDIKRIEGRFAKLPDERRIFYLSQLAKELQELSEEQQSRLT